jgi:hypothetical protein
MGGMKVELLAILTGVYVGIASHIHIPGVFENRAMRRIFVPKRDEVSAEVEKTI